MTAPAKPTSQAGYWGDLTLASYRTITVDPPWPFEHKLETLTRVGREKKDRSAEAHYSTMSLDDIAAMPVAELAHPEGCHL